MSVARKPPKLKWEDIIEIGSCIEKLRQEASELQHTILPLADAVDDRRLEHARYILQRIEGSMKEFKKDSTGLISLYEKLQEIGLLCDSELDIHALLDRNAV